MVNYNNDKQYHLYDLSWYLSKIMRQLLWFDAYKQISVMNRSAINPQHAVFTPIDTFRSRRRVNITPVDHADSDEERAFSALRPRTTPLVTRGINDTLNTTGRSSNFVHVRSISTVQHELNDRYGEDMNPYLRKKLHKIVEKKQEDFIPDVVFSGTLDITSRSRQSRAKRPLDYFYTSLNNENKMESQKGVDEAYLLTAKERIIRLIEMKKRKQLDYKSLNNKIKVKNAIHHEGKCKNSFEEFKKHTIEQEDWNKQWRQNVNRQNKRYKNRLQIKCNKQNNMFLSIEH